MPAKKTTKKTTKKATKKTAAKKITKAAVKKKAAAKMKKGQTYECRVCGLQVVVDAVCGCVEEHALICCMKPMNKAVKRKTTKKK